MLSRRIVLSLAGALFAVSCGGSGDGAGDGATNLVAWPMHPVANEFRGANALGPGDVNGDGFTDYVTNYEFDQRFVVTLHPGPGAGAAELRRPWPRVVAFVPDPLVNGAGVNPEHSALADLDGDGALDVVGAQGWSNLEFWEGSEPGIRVVWGPEPGRTLEASAWTDAGRIPESVDRGHLIFVVPLDVNGDGATDIVAGGRVHGGNGRRGGVIWIEAPAEPAARRDLAAWRVHDIDPEQWSGHGLLLTDVDADGDLDLALANADFDTPEAEEAVLWYEHPGAGSAALRAPWVRHEIERDPAYDGKPQLAAGDVDGDGLVDLVTQTATEVRWFRKRSLDPVRFERIVIPKPDTTRQFARPVRLADLDGDGRLDLVGGLSHEDGVLAPERYGVFWMHAAGDPRDPASWATRVIRWGSGRTMQLPIFGEKWDQMDLVDVDGDGDLDIVANCEEWWEDDLEFRFYFDGAVSPESVALVWFENRLREAPFRWAERDGVVAIEAEEPTEDRDGTWIERASYAGFAGSGYVQDHWRLGPENREADASLGLDYEVDVAGGSYTVWVRRFLPTRWGGALGRAESNSAWLLVDGAVVGDALDNENRDWAVWSWVSAGAPVELGAGTHRLGLRVREGGYAVDRIVLARDPTWRPRDAGPGATPAR